MEELRKKIGEKRTKFANFLGKKIPKFCDILGKDIPEFGGKRSLKIPKFGGNGKKNGEKWRKRLLKIWGKKNKICHFFTF